MTYIHRPVLLAEAVTAVLSAHPTALVVDGTFGRGGHSRAILNQIGSGVRLIAFDKDLSAIQEAQTITDSRFSIVHDSFAQMASYLQPGSVDEIGRAHV